MTVVSDTATAIELKTCCATFYQGGVVRALLGDVFHPGGLALTEHLGRRMALGVKDSVVDIACGRGTSALHLAQQFGCRVIGLDFGQDNVMAALASAANRDLTGLVDFRVGDAELLPFASTSFDALVSECSFCTFPDKIAAADEMARVLKPGGRLGLTDVTVNGSVPDDVQTVLTWVACVAGAGSAADYVRLLQDAGFTDFVVEDHRDVLLQMVEDVRRKLLGVDLLMALGKLDLGDMDVGEATRLARHGMKLIRDGTLGYTMIVAKRN